MGSSGVNRTDSHDMCMYVGRHWVDNPYPFGSARHSDGDWRLVLEASRHFQRRGRRSGLQGICRRILSSDAQATRFDKLDQSRHWQPLILSFIYRREIRHPHGELRYRGHSRCTCGSGDLEGLRSPPREAARRVRPVSRSISRQLTDRFGTGVARPVVPVVNAFQPKLTFNPSQSTRRKPSDQNTPQEQECVVNVRPL